MTSRLDDYIYVVCCLYYYVGMTPGLKINVIIYTNIYVVFKPILYTGHIINIYMCVPLESRIYII